VPGVSHIFIDKNQIIQRKVIAAIDAVVFNGGSRVSAADRQKPETAAVAPGAARAGAAAAN
jgi:hypothetical protein